MNSAWSLGVASLMVGGLLACGAEDADLMQWPRPVEPQGGSWERTPEATDDADPVNSAATTAEESAPFNAAAGLWVLVHRNYDPPLGPGIFLYDRESGDPVRHLELPESAVSPHALADEGHFLWLGALNVSEEGDTSSLYKLDRVTGEVLQRLQGIRTEGLAFDGKDLWIGPGNICPTPGAAIEALDSTEDSIPVSTIVNDLTSDGTNFYYVANDEHDPIIRVDRSGHETVIVPSAARGLCPYSLAFDGDHLLLEDQGLVRRFDPTSGEEAQPLPFVLGGWVTALAVERSTGAGSGGS